MRSRVQHSGDTTHWLLLQQSMINYFGLLQCEPCIANVTCSLPLATCPLGFFSTGNNTICRQCTACSSQALSPCTSTTDAVCADIEQECNCPKGYAGALCDVRDFVTKVSQLGHTCPSFFLGTSQSFFGMSQSFVGTSQAM